LTAEKRATIIIRNIIASQLKQKRGLHGGILTTNVIKRPRRPLNFTLVKQKQKN